jgi:hypothetical protein
LISLFRLNKFFEKKRFFFFEQQFSETEHYKKYFQLKNEKTFLFHLLVESLSFLLLFTQEKRTESEKFFVKSKYISISIHKPLEFLENQCQYSSLIFSGRFFCFLHPEILIRILRKKVQDSFFLHFLRKIFHSNLFCYKKNHCFKQITQILWNIYVLEIDNFFVADSKYYCFCYSRKLNFFGFNYSFSFLQKIFQWRFFLFREKFQKIFQSKNLLFSYSISTFSKNSLLDNENLNTNILTFQDPREKKQKNSFLEKSSIYKYVRANTNWFLFFQKQEPWNFLVKRRIFLYLIRRLGYLPNQKTITSTMMRLSTLSSKEIFSYLFLGYILQFSKKRSFVKINTKLFFFDEFFCSSYRFFS